MSLSKKPAVFFDKSSRRVAGMALLFLAWGLFLPQSTQAAGFWTSTGNLKVARCLHTATLLPNGLILAAGGKGIGGVNVVPISSAELYTPASGLWEETGSLAIPRGEHTATLLKNGKVLVAGGWNYGFLTSAEIYDPEKRTWEPTGSLSDPRVAHTATLLNNGKVLVVGGKAPAYADSLDSVWLYNPGQGTWAKTGSLITGRYSHTAALLPNGQVLVAGGYYHNHNNGDERVLANAELYDPVAGTWRDTGVLAIGRDNHAATLLLNGHVLVAGGISSSGSSLLSSELYNPASGTWETTGSLHLGQHGHKAALLLNGQALIAGGTNGPACEIYDPAAKSWAVTGSLNYARFNHTATLLPDGKVLVTGGNNWGYPFDGAEIYHPRGIDSILSVILN